MLVPNMPGQSPLPTSDLSWEFLSDSLFSMGVGFVAFIVAAMVLSKYLPENRLLAKCKIVLTGPDKLVVSAADVSAPINKVHPGDIGTAVSILRPAGEARFGDTLVSVMSEGNFIRPGTKVKVLSCDGNRVVVKTMDN